MNIFILDDNPVACAEYHLDKHVVKMPLETAQLICTAHWVTHFFGYTPQALSPYEFKKLREYSREYGNSIFPYKPAMPNHPCSIWVRSSLQNYLYLMTLGLSLGREYTHRYGRKHKSTQVLLDVPDIDLPDDGLTDFAQAMPDEYRNTDAITAYRDYYRGDKAYIAKWTKRDAPAWWGTA
tara:strand:+ start:62 stop:601 length:540 start_codon:yes stop_codon:yes gene_type:complete